MEQREAAGITIQLVIERVRTEFGEEGVHRLLELAEETRPLEVLENGRTWHSFATRRRFFDAGAELTGDKEFATSVGASILSSRRSALLRSLLSRLGSPVGILKALPVAQAKFDTACESKLLSIEPGSALIAFHTKDGYTPSPHDCRYAMGLFSQVTALFGMPATAVVHLQCQAEGAEHCLFRVSLPVGRRARSRLRGRSPATDLVQVQLEDLQLAMADLLQAREVYDVIAKVAEHAGSAVAAQQLLVAVRLGDGSPIEVTAEGFRPETALRLGTALLDTGVLPSRIDDVETFSLVSKVASREHEYGKIVAFSSAPFIEGEQQLLDSYARLASTALDASVALQVAEVRQHTAEVLGAFAARMILVQDVAGIAAATVEAARQIAGSDRAVVYRHNEEAGALATLAHSGYAGPMADSIEAVVITVEDTSILAQILASPDGAIIYDRATADDYTIMMMDRFGADYFAGVAIRSSMRVFGLLAVTWLKGNAPGNIDEVARQITAIADQAAGAWEKTLLLEQIHHQASIDTLTGLANRRVFAETLARFLGEECGPPLTVVFCDVDRFKSVNDALGHAAGDELLVAVGHRLTHCVRSDDLVARLGGDEFTVLMTDVDELWSPDVFASKVREAMDEPISIDGSQVVVRLSMGAVTATPGHATVKDVLRRADAAMYDAKARGGDRLRVFEEDMLLKRSERIELEVSLAEAVTDASQFLVLYEPQVRLSSGKVVGAEALVRWQHPVHGLLTPDRFLPVAEETGLITAIDLHVLRSALATLARWRRDGLALKVSVNFSARTLTSPGLVALVGRELNTAGVPGSRLEIELTESTAIVDPEALSRTLLALRGLDVSLAIDDVGTGYSSLALLHKLPAHKLKIDRSFVQRITEDDASRSVVEAVLLLADRLGQEVVAEGIETAAQEHELKLLGCHLAQGYLYARPASEESLRVLAEHGVRSLPRP